MRARKITTLAIAVALALCASLAPAQLTLPYSGTVNSAAPGFKVTQNGTGNGAWFLTMLGDYGVYGESAKSNGSGVRGVANNGANSAGLFGQSVNGRGVVGLSTAGEAGIKGKADKAGAAGVYGIANGSGGRGVYGTSTIGFGGFFSTTSGVGVYGTSTQKTGVSGYTSAVSGDYAGVLGKNVNNNYGMLGTTLSGAVGYSYSPNGYGVAGYATSGADAKGIYGVSTAGYGVYGSSDNRAGVYGKHASGNNGSLGGDNYGVYGVATTGSGTGVMGICETDPDGCGVYGHAVKGYGVFAIADEKYGIWGQTSAAGFAGVFGKSSATQNYGEIGGDTYGVRGEAMTSNGQGVSGYANSGPNAWGVAGFSSQGYAGYFSGKVNITGTLTKGGGAFKIDHPLDPENKYLQHSFVESPDMKNVYDGVARLDASGEAAVQLPEYFEALNRDFRYQLTAIGAPGPNLYIAEEISGNAFKVAGGSPGMKVSWQVTGIRQDAWAEAHRIQVEEDKAPEEQGRYVHPEAFGQPKQMSVTAASHPELVE